MRAAIVVVVEGGDGTDEFLTILDVLDLAEVEGVLREHGRLGLLIEQQASILVQLLLVLHQRECLLRLDSVDEVRVVRHDAVDAGGREA